MPAGVSWATYLKMCAASLLSMCAGAEVVHRYYRPDLVSARGPSLPPPGASPGPLRAPPSGPHRTEPGPHDGVPWRSEPCGACSRAGLRRPATCPRLPLILYHFAPRSHCGSHTAFLAVSLLVKPVPISRPGFFSSWNAFVPELGLVCYFKTSSLCSAICPQ